MGASFLPLMMFTLLWGGVGIVLPFLVPNGATEGLPDDLEGQQPSDNSFLSFHPKYFDFNQSPVGVPRLGVVTVDNRLKNENLKLISISGNTVHFHSSFFADKVIGPESNTTFEVVFLSRVEGLVESYLYIHTSKGLFKYYVRGFGLPNPYRLKPLVGARIPVNGTYEPLITMHNTHDTRIQVVEMFSSGADFHLQLPDESEQNAEGNAWAIEPFETKPVMKGSFQGKADGNHTGFIKIRVNSTADFSEYLVLPVEVQVSSEPGMYSPQDSLDFGLLVQTDKPKTLSLFIINAEHQPVNVQSVSVKGAPNPAVKIEFRPLVIEPDNSVSTVVALVTFDPSQASDPKYSHGMIQIQSECGKSVAVPFRATVMQGELQYNASSLGFFVKSDIIPLRNFSVRNNYSATVAIYHVAVSHPELVKVSFNQTHVIPPGEQKMIFSMKIQRKGEICDARNKVEVTVKSNITDIKLPLTCYDGKLQMHTFENGEIDCGRIEMFSSRTEYFSLENKNPVEIRLKSWGSNSSWGHVELVGMQKGVKEDLERIKDFDILKKSLFLQPGHVAIFSIEIRRPSTEGTFYGEAYVTTDHNQTLRIPFRFAVSKGSVYAETFVFDKVFPGKISCEKLYLGSSYNRTLHLSAIRSRPHKLLWFSPSPSENPEIHPNRRSYVGKVHFDPRKFCDVDCYAGFTLKSALGKSWTKAARLGWEGGETDWEILSTLQRRYEGLGDITVSNISVWVDTNEGGGYKVPTQVNYIWPRVTSQKPIVFPLTALGNESTIEIPVNNPSSFPLLVQAVLANEYGPQWSRFLAGSPSANNNFNNVSGGNFSAGEQAFKISGVVSSSHLNNSVSVEVADVHNAFREKLLEELGDDLKIPGLAFMVPAGLKFLLRLTFQPQSKDIASTVILLRNNLTGIEVVSIKGRAGTGQLTVGSGPPGSVLLFQLTEKLLQACQTESTSKYVPPQLTVRRSFVARNIGEIPLDIKAVEIYTPESVVFGFPWHIPFGLGNGYFGGATYPVGEYCEGYGFRILNCHSFTLQPNQTHSIDIAFSPDFTMSKVVRTLRLVDAGGTEFNYTLLAMIPSNMLSICSSIISRPAWEYVLKIFLLIGIVVAIIAACLMAYVEAGSVVSNTVVATVRVVSGSDPNSKDAKENTTKLDLKAVYDKVENRFKRNNKENNKTSAANYSTTNAHSPGTGVQVPNGTAGCSKSSQQISNGTNNILSNNNNSTLRRRTKKGGTESNSTPPTTVFASSTKLIDKSNQKSSSPIEEINHVSSTGGFSKKNKENSPSTTEVSNAVQNLSNVTNSKKKKGSTTVISPSQNVQNSLTAPTSSVKQKKRRNSGSSGSMPSLVTLNAKGVNKAEQEETSSTTTESSNCSNSDDFYVSLSNNISDKKSSQQHPQIKSSRTGSSSQDSLIGASQQMKINSGKLSKQETGGKKKQGIDSCHLGKTEIFEDGNVSLRQKTSSPSTTDDSSSSGNKKKNAKRKDQMQNMFNADPSKIFEGKVSPSIRHCHHHPHNEISMWDLPQSAAGDGLSEMAAQTEAFVMHRPTTVNKKSGSTEHLIGGSNPDGRHIRNSHSPQFSQLLQMSACTNFSLQPQQHQQLMHMSSNTTTGPRRRPTAGIIGQSRHYGSGLSPTSSYYSQLPSQAGHQHQSGRQHTPPTRTLSNSNALSMNNSWGTEILPDNGCDIWSRKNSIEANGGLNQTFSSVAGSTASSISNDGPLYSSGNMVQSAYSSIFDGFPTSSSPGLSNRSSDDGGYFSLGSGVAAGGIMTSTTSTSGVSSSVSSYGGNANVSGGMSRSGNDNSQMFNNYGMEIFNTLTLPVQTSTYDAQFRNPVTGNVQRTKAPSSGTGTSHNYLQRMRSEPTNRDENRTFASSSKNWNDMKYFDMDNVGATSSRLTSRSSNSPNGLDPGNSETSGEMAWSTAASPSGIPNVGSKENMSQERGLYSDWASVPAGRRSVGSVSEIWEPTALGSTQDTTSKWPTSFDNHNSDSTAVGLGGARVNSGASSRLDSGLGNLTFPVPSSRTTDVPQNHHHEVERGLGFNPFTSNIWNQSNSSDNNWSSSSTPSYNNRYNNRD